jgi:hypothetical protein
LKLQLDFRTTTASVLEGGPIAMPNGPGYFSSSDQLDDIRRLFEKVHIGSGPSLR